MFMYSVIQEEWEEWISTFQAKALHQLVQPQYSSSNTCWWKSFVKNVAIGSSRHKMLIIKFQLTQGVFHTFTKYYQFNLPSLLLHDRRWGI